MLSIIGIVGMLVLMAAALAAAAASSRTRRLVLAGGVATGVLTVSAVAVLSAGPAPQVNADNCVGAVEINGLVVPCSGLSGGSVSAGAPSQELLTAKNWCNLVIGGCSAAFYYPPGPVNRPDVDNTVRHSP